MLVRQLLVKGIDLAGSILLARLLAPESWGVFLIVSWVVQYATQIGTFGFGAALVQQAGPPTESALRTVFTAQATASFVLCAALWPVAVPIAAHYNLPGGGEWLLRILGFSIVLASLRTVPSVLLERALRFDRIALVEVAETAVFQACAVALAWNGFGVWSFVLAVLARGVAAVALLYAYHPWIPRPGFDRTAWRDLVRFGIPYQGNSLVSAIGEGFIPLVIGTLLGKTAVGFAGWAMNLVNHPTRLLWSFEKVMFPVFSRLQADTSACGRAVEKAARVNALIAFPLQIGLLALAPEIVEVVFTAKWLPAVPLVSILILANLHVGPTMPVGNALLALGESGFWFRICLLWTAFPWIAGIPLVRALGLPGYGVVMLAMAGTILIPVRRLRRRVPFFLWPQVRAPLLAASLAAGVISLAKATLYRGELQSLLLLVGLFAATHALALWGLAGSALREDLGSLRRAWSRGGPP